jgi:hypothetical protein
VIVFYSFQELTTERMLVVDAEVFNQEKIMPLQDVAVFNEDGMQGTIALFLLIRYQSKCRKRWPIKVLFPRPKPEHRWAIQAIFTNTNEENKTLDCFTFEQTEKNGQKHLACCRGHSVPLALQEFRYLCKIPCTPKNLFQCARQFQDNGRMNEPDWYLQFVKSVNEDFDDESSRCKTFEKVVTRETLDNSEKKIFIQACFYLLLNPFYWGACSRIFVAWWKSKQFEGKGAE